MGFIIDSTFVLRKSVSRPYTSFALEHFKAPIIFATSASEISSNLKIGCLLFIGLDRNLGGLKSLVISETEFRKKLLKIQAKVR